MATHTSLSDAPAGKAFVLHTGNVILSLKELSESLKTMPDEIFHYHVNSEKNDFSNWIKGVFKEKELAESVSGVKNKQKMADLIKKRIFFLESLKKIDESNSQGILRSAMVDFAIGIIIGAIIGIIIGTFI